MNKALAAALAVLIISISYFYFQSFNGSVEAQKVVLAGWRSSPYGYQLQRDPGYWAYSALDMSSKVAGTPSGVWVIGNVLEDGTCKLGFPSNATYGSVIFSENDTAEKYLDAFDNTGTKIWLQVEPGDADVADLIDLVLGRYGNHSSVIGFGIDVEWLNFLSSKDGRKVTDAEVLKWLGRARRYNQSYMLFLKHWKMEKMPAVQPEGLVFMQDAQDFGRYGAIMGNYTAWGVNFSNASVAYMFGYESDRNVWGSIEDPFAKISSDIIAAIPNAMGVYWVDFTIRDLYP